MAYGRIGWFIGLVVGAVAGLLFAPREGKKLREQIKSDRKRGNLGIAPLKDDMKKLGEELAGLAVGFYESEPVQDIVEIGREKMQDISRDIVQNAHDFHAQRLKPIQEEMEEKVDFMKSKVDEGKSTVKKTMKNVNESARIGKKALSRIKQQFKKK